MNDKAAASQVASQAFDPAAHGWVRHETVGFNALIGPLWRHEAGQRLRFGVVIAEKHLNRIAIVHGGMLATFADQAMGMTARKAHGNKTHATIELSLQFVGSVQLGEFVEAHSEVVRMTRSIMFMRTTLVVGTRIVATASGIWKILE